MAQATPIPVWTDRETDFVAGAPGDCDGPDGPCHFTGATYQTFGVFAFLPGLRMYIPDGWNSTEQDAGEFNLGDPKIPDSGLLFWRDMIPVTRDGERLTNVPSTAAAVTEWLRADPDLVVSQPERMTIGKGLPMTTFVVEVAEGAENHDPECARMAAKSVVCFPILTDPGHWGDSWWIASLHSERFYLADIGPAAHRHLFIIALIGSLSPNDAHPVSTPAAERRKFEKAAAPILDSVDVSPVTFN